MPTSFIRPQAMSARVVGILLMVAAFLIFALNNAMAKYLTLDYSVGLIVWGRYFFQTLVLAPSFVGLPAARLVRQSRWKPQIFRGLLAMIGNAFYFTALAYIPLAEASAIGYASPLFVTALSVVILGEAVGIRRWAAVFLGLAGVLIIIRPGLGVMHWAAALPLAMAVCFANFQILTRILSSTEDPRVTLMFTAGVGVVFSSLALPFFWEAPTWQAWVLLMLLGASAAAGHYLLIQAYARAPASLLSPFVYSQLIWATLIGLWLFGDFPDGWTIFGAVIVTASGLYTFYREGLRARPAGERSE